MAGLFPCDWSQPRPRWRRARALAGLPSPHTAIIERPDFSQMPQNDAIPVPGGRQVFQPVPGAIRLARPTGQSCNAGACPALGGIPPREQCLPAPLDQDLEREAGLAMSVESGCYDPGQVLEAVEKVNCNLDDSIERLNRAPRHESNGVDRATVLEMLVGFSRYSHKMERFIRSMPGRG